MGAGTLGTASIDAGEESRIMPLRDARPEDDAAAIAEIYNDAVLHTRAIWNDTTVDAADRAAWVRGRQKVGYPVIVAVDDEDRVIGYASFGDWRAFEGFRHTVEHSVYIHPDQRRGGLGRTLMLELIDRARQAGKHVMIAGVEARNTGSIRLHEQLGFLHGGTLPQVGIKFGEWLDLTFLQLRLDERAASDVR
jgi:L-amino acid N-acyltransferase